VGNIVILHHKREEHGSWKGDYGWVIVEVVTDFEGRQYRDQAGMYTVDEKVIDELGQRGSIGQFVLFR
jgi:hypothetical protein